MFFFPGVPAWFVSCMYLPHLDFLFLQSCGIFVKYHWPSKPDSLEPSPTVNYQLGIILGSWLSLLWELWYNLFFKFRIIHLWIWDLTFITRPLLLSCCGFFFYFVYRYFFWDNLIFFFLMVVWQLWFWCFCKKDFILLHKSFSNSLLYFLWLNDLIIRTLCMKITFVGIWRLW